MKKRIIPVWMLFAASGFLSAQANPSSGENYIYTKTNLSDPSLPGTPKIAETVQYFDGLGRPSQVVNVKASPSGKDLVTQIPYDPFGRQTESWLPAPMATSNGAIQSGVGSAAQTYYNDNFPFSRNNMEASPLNRVLSQVQPGSDWQQHPVGLEYEVNGGDVNKYTATYSYSTLQSSISLSGTYGENQLYKNTATDEDGNISIEFKNKEGQTILIRKMLSAAEKADTYYVYNEYNQLAYVIPPLASISGTVNQTTLDQLCYQYKYDERNRLVEKKLPGKGWEYMVYDRQDRLVLSQDANMRKTDTALNNFGKKGWMFTKYDQFGRVIYTGFFANTSTRTAMQSAINSMNANKENVEFRTSTAFILNGMDIYYDKKAFPTGSMTILSVNYYDAYPAGAPAVPAQILSQDVIQEITPSGITTKSRPVVSYVKNIENDNWTKNYIWYDKKGRTIGGHSINHLGGYTKTESLIDFSGLPLQTITRHKRLSSDTERVITENFQYDAQNRLLVHKHQVDTNPEEILTQNTYNDIAQITNKKVGGTSASTPLQSINYAYNIRGWMTNINDPENLGNDLFGYKINYTLVEGMETPNTNFSELKVKPKYNGNIAEVIWKTATIPNDNVRKYGYVYDGFNRLLAGFYQKDTNPAAKEYFERQEYDLNGNITRLERSTGDFGQGSNAMKIDNLQYQYTGNKLISVKDDQQNSTGYPYFATPNIIQYDNDTGDGNGNMIKNLDKKIISLKYNYLNLSNTILGNNYNISYTYRADGIKVGKVFSSGTFSNFNTDYIDGFQYSKNDNFPAGDSKDFLQFFPTAEGYFDYQQSKYVYHYTDHLGNIRVSYMANGTAPRIIEENNYYPFGLKHQGYNNLSGNPNYQYKYNGKELQETGMYDYGARMYMSDIGRWGVIDAMSEKYRRWSPYNYAINNPVRFTDPDGNDPLYGEEAQAFFRQLQNSISSKPTDDITVNKKGIISNISRNNKPNRFFDESGKQLFFNDSQQDDKYMLSQYFEVNDRLYYPISDSDLKTQVTNVHHNNQLILMNGMDNWGSKFNSYIDLFLNSYNFVPGKGSDFTYSFLVPFLKNKNVNITNENLQDKFIPNAFFKFDNVNMIYNTFDAGNFMWGAWTKYIGLSAEKAMWGARMNEFGSDSSRDQNALWRGNKYFYKGTYKK
ncbi:DUF6443 domain-containing protein [uncultured Chryseobacterium sp.]|uniref:DUF6443 domain-containing protein n=1 Tax=uncultured Chryseobacterium sp. TaxID=259322 RepID=UPI002600C0C9|nr:DUF6443 domain-containing protein [uncultured Chryseobacterium sp.]